MNFINPWGLFFLSFVPLVIVLYLLKLRRKPVVVPSILFWQRAVNEMEANVPFQRLRKNLLLLLQLLIMILLAVIIARPFFKSEAEDLKDAIIIIDISASMQAKDLGKSRFAVAKDRAIEIIDGLGDHDNGMIMAAARTPRVILNFNNDKNRLKSAIRDLKITDTTANIREALIMASSLRTSQAGRIFLLSDGGGESLRDVDVDNITYVALGESAENVAITALDVRQSTELDYQIFVTLQNYGRNTIDGNLEFYVDENLIDVRPVEIKGRSTKSQLFENFGAQVGVVTVKLDVDDVLEVDNIAYSVIPESKSRQILLVSRENYFLERVLNLDPQVTLFRVSPSDYRLNNRYDVTVFDGFLPSELPPGNFLIVNTSPPLEIGTSAGQVKTPQIIDWKHTHPVMRYVDLQDVQIAKTRQIAVRGPVEILAESKETPLIVAAHTLNHHLIYVGFDLFDSNFPLRVSFPIFTANALHWLIHRGEESTVAQIKTGDIYPIHLPPNVSKAVIKTPTNTEIKLGGKQNPLRFGQTDYAGVYQVQMVDSTALFVANLLDEQESNIKPRPQLVFGENNTISGSSKVKINKEFWRWLAFLVLGLILVEWWVYHRRVGV